MYLSHCWLGKLLKHPHEERNKHGELLLVFFLYEMWQVIVTKSAVKSSEKMCLNSSSISFATVQSNLKEK